MDRDSLERLLAQGVSVEKIGRRFGKHPSTVSYWIAKFGLSARYREKHAPKGGIEQAQLERLIDEGRTIAGIADAVGMSKAAVRYWLGRYGLRTRAAEQMATVGASRDAGLATVTMICKRHGETEFVMEGRSYYRCRLCRSAQVSDRRRAVKALLIAEAGGRCVVCGYDRCPRALEFHHLDRDGKRLTLSAQGIALALATLREEAAKCVLLCSNCHAEVESGLLTLPVK